MSQIDLPADGPRECPVADSSPVTPEYFSPRPPSRRTPRRNLLVEHNPFYLLSAACMLASCLALTNSLSWIPLATTRLITLIVTLNVYEFALLGIALYLVTERNLQRDGRMLLMLQAFFLVDFSFLNAEIATADLATGAWVNAVLFALAAAKLGIVVRVLRPTFTPLQFAFVLLQLGLLFAVPCVMRWHHLRHGALGPEDFYAFWWLLALLPAGAELLATFDARGDEPASVSSQAQAAPTMTYLGLPYASLLTHIGIMHYVYDVRFYGAHAAPLLLGLTLVLHRANPSKRMPRRDLLILRLLLPFSAVLVSLNEPFEIWEPKFAYPVLSVTPLSLTVVAAFLVIVYCVLARHARLLLAVGAAALAFHVFGPSRRHVIAATETLWQWTGAVIDRLTPRTLADWGIIGLVASFGFLAIGFWVSLRKRPGEEMTPESEVAVVTVPSVGAV